jgi:hypothetical protein
MIANRNCQSVGDVLDLDVGFVASRMQVNICKAGLYDPEDGQFRLFNKFGTHGLLWTAAANLLMFAIAAAVFATHVLGLRTLPASNAKSSKSG